MATIYFLTTLRSANSAPDAVDSRPFCPSSSAATSSSCPIILLPTASPGCALSSRSAGSTKSDARLGIDALRSYHVQTAPTGATVRDAPGPHLGEPRRRRHALLRHGPASDDGLGARRLQAQRQGNRLMANPGRTRPASLGPIDPDEPPIPQIFPKLQREVDSYGASDEETDYVAAVHAIIEDARDFNESFLAPAREYATALYNGELPGAADEGRSSIVLTEVRDLVLAMLPSLVRLFTSPEHPCYFSPRTEADVAMAEEAQDYVSYVWKYDNPGFLNLNAILKDALIKRTGIVKWWTEREAEIVELQYRGLTLEQRQYIISQPRTQVVKEERRDSPKIEGAAPGNPTVGPPGPMEAAGAVRPSPGGGRPSCRDGEGHRAALRHYGQALQADAEAPCRGACRRTSFGSRARPRTSRRRRSSAMSGWCRCRSSSQMGYAARRSCRRVRRLRPELVDGRAGRAQPWRPRHDARQCPFGRRGRPADLVRRVVHPHRQGRRRRPRAAPHLHDRRRRRDHRRTSRRRGRSSRSSARTPSRTPPSATPSASRSRICSTSRPTSCATSSTRWPRPFCRASSSSTPWRTWTTSGTTSWARSSGSSRPRPSRSCRRRRRPRSCSRCSNTSISSARGAPASPSSRRGSIRRRCSRRRRRPCRCSSPGRRSASSW